MTGKQEFVEKMNARLSLWDAELARLEAKADLKKAEAKAEYNQNLETLRNKKRQAEGKLNEMKQAGENAWQDLKSGTEAAFTTFKDSLQDAVSRF